MYSKLLMLITIGLIAANTLAEQASTDIRGAVIETRQAPSKAELNAPTQVVVLGTSTPVPDRYRAGPSIAVIHKGQAYLFDVGSGVVQRAIEARYKYDIPSLYPSQIAGVFFTHLHSDHTLDYVDLSQSLWWRRSAKLKAWGPMGLKGMTDGMYQMMAADIKLRTGGAQPVKNPELYKVEVTEISDGFIFETAGMTVEAFTVPHGEIKPAFGYKITTPDKTIVISGDTAYSEKILDMSRGVDLLFHEVISDAGLAKNAPHWQAYHKKSHTLASDIGKLAQQAKPKKVVLYHGLFYGVAESLVVDEVKAEFDGEVVLANDLDVF